MEPRLEILTEKKLAGLKTEMSFANNKTRELWQMFMPRRVELINSVCADLYSLEIYPPDFFKHFNPTSVFEKWAATEVSSFDQVPVGMNVVTIPEGLYAIFIHKGPAREAAKTYQYIFSTWMPQSNFVVDERPHFALMGSRYKNDDPDSEEEIWIPVRKKV
ncbi:GyrI-like domain-containing protein [Flavihumibacter sediminis]|nr:GyrI-like domain-containing protein [Flavihumibacter sediminis]